MEKNILNTIEEVVKKYYCAVDDCTKRIRYDEDDNEFWIEKEIEAAIFDLNEGSYDIKVVEAYSSCSYEVDILVIAYHDENDTLKLYTKKLELH